MAGTRLAAPLLALSEGYGAISIGVLVALFAVTQIFLAIPAGRAIGRHGLPGPVTCSALGSSIGIGLAAIWPTYPMLCIAALVSGGAVGTSVMALQHHVARVAKTAPELKQAFAWISIAPSVSIFLGPIIAGLLIDLTGYRVAFAALALMPVGTWLFIRKVPRFPRAEVLGHDNSSAWSLWRDADFRRLFLLNWFMTASWDLHAFMVPLLGHERGLSASSIGTILGTFALAATISRVAMPMIARLMREWMLISVALAVTGVLFGIYPFAYSILAMCLCSLVLGFVLGGIQPTVMIILHHITPAHQHSHALAMRLMTTNASGVAMPMIFGAAGGLIGISGVFWIVAVIVGLGSSAGYSLKDAAPK